MSDILQAVVEVERIRFFNAQTNFGIVVCSVDKVIEGTPVYNDEKMIIVKGVMVEPNLGGQYNLKGELVNDAKWGQQYNVLSFSAAVPLTTDDRFAQKKYLCSLFTPYEVENMYDALENPYMALYNKDAEQLVTIRGCGMKVANRWIERFHENLNIAKILLELSEFNLTNNMISKLLKKYKSPELVIDKVKKNPYILIEEVDGVGWKTADKIALDGGLNPYCPERIGGFVLYYLGLCGESGRSWVEPDELLGAILENLGDDVPDLNISETIRGLGDKLWFNEERDKIGLMKYYNLEKKVAEELIRLRDSDPIIDSEEYKDWEHNIKRQEELQGWEFTEDQKRGIHMALTNNVMYITGAAGCVDCDTEFFNGKEWKKISEYTMGEPVLQYHVDTEKADLVVPNAYIVNPAEYLWHFSTKYGLDQCLSENHNCITVSPKGMIYEETFGEIMDRQTTYGNYNRRFMTTFSYDGKGIDISDEMIRLYIAICADGYIRNNKMIRFNLTKERKIQRLMQLCKEAGVPYSIQKYNKKVQTKSLDIFIVVPNAFKQFPTEWYNCSTKQKQIIADEIFFWDGEWERKNRYATANKSDADFIQFVFTSLGIRTSILTFDRRGRVHNDYVTKSIEYVVNITQKRGMKTAGLCHNSKNNTSFERYKTKDGKEYCFNVPTHALVLRRNNKIFITGNCGKTSLVGGVLKVLGKHDFAQAALSGRAASRMQEITGEEGYTIHRLLGYPSTDDIAKNGFYFNQDNKMHKEIYIIDEISMIGLELFYHLIRAIPDGAKVLLIGDYGQLESIGSGNIAYDILHSESIPSILLTKIHRQAARSGIISESMKVREGIQLIEKDWTGDEIRGELQDLRIKCYLDRNNTYFEVLEAFSNELNKENFNILNTQIIVPVKKRGQCCTYELNNAIQEMYNPKSDKKKEATSYRDGKLYILRVGDKVINRVNNYKTNPPIYNGNIGILKRFDWNEDDEEVMIIDFVGIGEVEIHSDYWNNLELAYALTCHSVQGSQFEYVIIGLDYDSYSLLTKELVYTAITRGIKRVMLVAQTGALRVAVAKEGVSNKQTHLQNCLYDIDHPKIIF